MNYDCLLDLALDAAGLGYHDGVRLGPYPHPSRVRLWKLHGACNVLPDVGTNVFMGNRFVGNAQIFEGPVAYVTRAHVIANYDQEGLPPMLSLYAPGKPTPVALATVTAIRQAWQEWIRKSDVLVVIGARILRCDPHIFRPLKKAPGEIWFVGDHRDFHGDRRVTVLGRRFADSLDGPLVERIASIAENHGNRRRSWS